LKQAKVSFCQKGDAMQYNAPLNVDLSPEVRAVTYRQRRVKAATNHAKWAARQYANVMVRMQLANFGANALDIAGGETGIAKAMATYQVFEPLQQFAARQCVRLIREKLAKQP